MGGKKGWEQERHNCRKTFWTTEKATCLLCNIILSFALQKYICTIFFTLSRLLTVTIWLHMQKNLCSGSEHYISEDGVWQKANLLLLNSTESANFPYHVSYFCLFLLELSLMFPTLSMRYVFWLNLFSLCSLKNESGLSEHFKSIWLTFNQYPFEHLNVFMMSLLTICSKSINQLNCFFLDGSFCKPRLIQDGSWDTWGSEPEHQNKPHLGSRSKIMARPYNFHTYLLLIYFLD